MVKVNAFTLTFDFSSSNIFYNSWNIFSYIFILFPSIIDRSHFLETLIRPKFDQVNSSIKVNHVLCGSTRSLQCTWFHIFNHCEFGIINFVWPTIACFNDYTTSFRELARKRCHRSGIFHVCNIFSNEFLLFFIHFSCCQVTKFRRNILALKGVFDWRAWLECVFVVDIFIMIIIHWLFYFFNLFNHIFIFSNH